MLWFGCDYENDIVPHSSVASVGSSQAGPGRSDNTEQVIALSWAGLAHGSGLILTFTRVSESGPTHIFPSSHPAAASHTQTASRLESHHQSPDLVITTSIFWAQNTSKTQKLLGLECGAQLGHCDLWEWDHDRSDHWAILSPLSRVRCRAILRDIWVLITCSDIMSSHLCHKLSHVASLLFHHDTSHVVPSSYLYLIS